MELARWPVWSNPTAVQACLLLACPNGHNWLATWRCRRTTSKERKISAKSTCFAPISPLEHSWSTPLAVWIDKGTDQEHSLPLQQPSAVRMAGLDLVIIKKRKHKAQKPAGKYVHHLYPNTISVTWPQVVYIFSCCFLSWSNPSTGYKDVLECSFRRQCWSQYDCTSWV